MNNNYIEENKKWWNEMAEINYHSKLYDVERFIKGEKELLSVVKNEIKEYVKDKDILHLHCHFGMDSISLIREGAKRVTGVDFSAEAIKYANSLKDNLKLENLDYIECNVLELDKFLNKKYDMVFATLGVITWIGDLNKWMKIASNFLKEDGILYLMDYHPFAATFAHGPGVNELKIEYDYFEKDTPYHFENEVAYSNPSIKLKNASNEWQHSISGIINAIASNKMRIEKFKEYPFIDYHKFDFMVETPDKNYWYLPNYDLPYMFSIVARREKANEYNRD